MGPLASLALRQTLSGRGLVGILALGVVVAAALLASAPIYARAMADLGLTYVIRSELEDNHASRAEFFKLPLQTQEGQDIRTAVERRIDERLGWFRESQSRSIRAGKFWVTKPGAAVRDRNPFGEPASVTGYESHIRVLTGRLPQARPDGIIEVIMSPRGAQLSGMQLNETFDLFEEFDNCERELSNEPFPPPPPPCPITASVEVRFQAMLVGTAEPSDPDESFWVGLAHRYFDPFQQPVVGAGQTIPMLTSEDALLQGFGGRFPAFRAYHAWLIVAEPERLTRTNFERARDDIIALGGEFDPLGGFAYSPLRDTLLQFGRSADYQQVPLTILLLEITGIALFYVGLVAAIVVERQTGEIALLRGRGASLGQILLIYAVQGLLVAVPALLAGPFIAGGVTALLGLTPLFDGVTDGELLPVTIMPSAFGLAAVGAVLSVVALVLPALFAAYRGTAAIKRSQSRPGSSVFQRYYLDLGLAAVAIILLVELNQRGTVFTPSSTGGVSSDPLLLASPALAIAAASALILRFYPLLLRLFARVANVVAGPSVALGLWQVVRNSGQYTRLTLLLMMAVSVGTFAASYTKTADRSYNDRANFTAGVDIRAVSPTGASSGSVRDVVKFGALAADLPGVGDASVVLRKPASPAVAGGSAATYQVLGIDPKAARSMLWWRDDLADRPIEDLLGLIDGLAPPPSKVLPEGSKSLSLWVRADQALSGTTIRAGLRDASGQFGLVAIGELDFLGQDWTELTGDLSKTTLFEPKFPLEVVSLVFTGVTFRPTIPPLFFDDFSVKDATGKATLLEDWEGASEWTLFPTTATAPDGYSVSDQKPHAGAGAGRYTFKPGSSNETRGLYLSGFLTPLPALVSEDFLAQTGQKLGSEITIRVEGGPLVPLVIRGIFDLFPGTRSAEGPVVVFNRDRLLYWTSIAVSAIGAPVEPNEIWLDLEPGADDEALIDALAAPPFSLTNAVSRAQELADATSNPLIAASGSGILSAAFVAVIGLVIAAMLTSLIAAVRRRRVEFAVIRAIGLSRGQLLRMLALEYAIVFVVGVAVGCGLGLFVSRRMLSFLEVGETGEAVEPAFILETRWLYVAAAVLTVLVVFSATLWLAARIVGRSADAQALRTE
ncbi:MAG: FtsX-like permease family protein [Dehalococcoidia bacterium]